ncbi:MAG: nitroreductase family protein [Bacteroidales bacterium]|nr:nitroreductase family protein [Bacteroidales bacterium]
MKFLDLIQQRQSVRAYDPDRPVAREKLERCIEAVRLAPSACNSQPWKLVVVDEPILKEKVAKAATSKLLGFNHFTRQAPILVAVVREDPNLTSKLGAVLKDKPYTLMDVGIAVEHFCLQATEEGLGTCIMGWFDEEKVKQLLEVPKKKRVELIIALGYPAKEQVRIKIRKTTGEICSYNKYA